jgi:hypothetical protein
MCGGDLVSPATVLYNNLGDAIPLSLDAFQRLRVSNIATIFDSKQIYDEQPLYWTTAVTGGGTIVYSNQRASSALSVVANNDSAVRQTKRYFSYQPGKSQLVFATFCFTGGYVASVTRRVGYFDVNNGIYLQMSGGDLAVVIRSNVSGVVTNTVIDRSLWIDKLDGSGPSHAILDPSAAQILFLDFEWLGVGTVRIGLVIDGQMIPVYQFNNANALTSVYMQTPNLPVRYECSSSGGSGSLEAICCSVNSEGGQDFIGTQRVAVRDAGNLIAAAAIEQIIAIRNKTGVYLHTPIIPYNISIACSSTGQGIWRLLLNPTVTGAFTPVAVPNSAVEYDVSRTVVTALGTQLASGVFASDTSDSVASIKEALVLGVTLAGVADELVLAVTNINSGSETYYGTLSWLEPN